MNISSRQSQYILRRFLTLLFFIIGYLSLTAQNGISNYRVYFAFGKLQSENVLIIRKFEQSGQQLFVGVDIDNLETKIIPSGQISVKTLSWQQILLNYSNSAYVRAIKAAKNNSFSIQNSGDSLLLSFFVFLD